MEINWQNGEDFCWTPSGSTLHIPTFPRVETRGNSREILSGLKNLYTTYFLLFHGLKSVAIHDKSLQD